MNAEATKILLVALGGAIGSVGRYMVGGWVQTIAGPRFPWGTLAVNVLGCAAIGLVMYLALQRQALSANTRVFLTIGILGGFTTFSSFGYETLALLQKRDIGLALANAGGSLALGLAAVWAGWAGARLVWG